MYQMLAGTFAIHSLNLIHRDLKSENVFFFFIFLFIHLKKIDF